jgi:prepilin-type N-terminal cleavage/methylation domain-containing protein
MIGSISTTANLAMKTGAKTPWMRPVRWAAGFTLPEAMIALLIAGIIGSAVVGGYLLSLRTAEFTTYSVAANAAAVQRFEQARSAKWDAVAYPIVDDLVSSNFPPQVVVLDVPGSGNNPVTGTNFTTITMISTNPLLKMIRVDCVYSPDHDRLVTNTIVSYRAPDTGQQNLTSFSPPGSYSLPPASGTTTNASNSRGTSSSSDDDDDD